MKKISAILLLCLGCQFLVSQNLYDNTVIRTLEIDFYNPSYDASLKSHWLLEDGYREPASLKLDGVLYDSVAVRYKGNSTFAVARDAGNPKLPLNIDMNDLVSGQKLLGYKKIKLANALFDPTMAREAWAYKTYRKYLPASEANHVKVFIQGTYTGVYVNTESIDKTFLKKHFDYDDGVLFKCDPASQFGTSGPSFDPDLLYYGADSAQYKDRYDIKTDTGWRELIELTDILNRQPDSIHTILNVDRVLWYFAVNNVIANLDTYNGFFIHNYYLYQHENGLFQIIPWDLSESFGGALLTFQSQNTIDKWDPMYGYSPVVNDRPLVHKILSQPLYRKQYLAHVRTVLEESMNLAALPGEIATIQNVIRADALADPNTFFAAGNFTSNVTQSIRTFSLNISGIMVTATGHLNYLSSHPEVKKLAPEILQVAQTPLFPKENEVVFVTAKVTNVTHLDLMVTTSPYASHFKPVQMKDDGLHGDGQANDGIFGAEIPFQQDKDEVKYYIRAQNAEAMKLDPVRAEYEFHTYTIGANPLSVDLKIESPFQVYPNPSGDVFFLSPKPTTQIENTSATISDISGKQMLEIKIDAKSETKVDLSLYPAGVYFLKIPGFPSIKLLKSNP